MPPKNNNVENTNTNKKPVNAFGDEIGYDPFEEEEREEREREEKERQRREAESKKNFFERGFDENAPQQEIAKKKSKELPKDLLKNIFDDDELDNSVETKKKQAPKQEANINAEPPKERTTREKLADIFGDKFFFEEKEEEPPEEEEQPKPEEEQPKPEEEQPKPEEEQPKPEEEQPKPEEEQPKPEEKKERKLSPLEAALLDEDNTGEYEFANGFKPKIPDFILRNAVPVDEIEVREQKVEDLNVKVFTNKPITIKAENIRKANDILAQHEDINFQNTNDPAQNTNDPVQNTNNPTQNTNNPTQNTNNPTQNTNAPKQTTSKSKQKANTANQKDEADIFANVTEQLEALEKEQDKINDVADAQMFIEKLNTFNKMYKTNIDANEFVYAATVSAKLMKSAYKQKRDDGKAILGESFKDTLKKAFDVEKKAAYEEHRMPEYTEIIKSANELSRTAMFAFTDVYLENNTSLFEATGFGGIDAKEMAELTKSGESLWDIDQKSDEAWEIQSMPAKKIADEWLKKDDPYETMISEVQALVDAKKNKTVDDKTIYNKLAAAEWLLMGNDKLMVEDDYDPLNKVPNWGTRQWRAITDARERMGIPKHISMRDLIQGEYSEIAKTVKNTKYQKKQIEKQVLDPKPRQACDSMEKQNETFTIQREGIATNSPDNEKRILDMEMTEKRVKIYIAELDERLKIRKASKDATRTKEKTATLETGANTI